MPGARPGIFKRRPEETLKPYLDRVSRELSLRLGMFFFVPLLLINTVLTWDEPVVRFSGRVVDQHGDPVQYPVVTWDTDSQRIVFPLDSSGETTGDARGRFHLKSKHLTARTVIVASISAAGYRDSRLPEERVFHFMDDAGMFSEEDGPRTFVVERLE